MSACLPIDLDAYLARIGYYGSREPNRETLTALHQRHVETIPFENLDVLLGRTIQIDLASIERKLVRDRRGGYCFEQNNLLGAALQTLGYAVTFLIAHVRWQVPAEIPTAATHMLLRIDFADGAFLADVGFGSMSLLRPLALELDREQNTVSFEPRRLVRRGSSIVQQARLGNEWNDVYHFTLEPATRADFEMGNWFTCTFPQSRFKQNLALARSDDSCRRTLLNREFTLRFADGRVEKRLIETPDELLAVMAEHFGLSFPPGTRFGEPGGAWPV